MAARRTQGCTCGGQGGNSSRRSGGGKWWKWLAGAAIVYVLVQANQGQDTGNTDYKPPAQTQTDQKKCDPDALIQFGCTP